MDIKNKLFKFKRAVHRNRETIARAISITLTVALVAVVGYAAYKIYQSDLAFEAAANNVIVDEDKIPSGKAPKEDYLAFNLVAENEKLTLEANYTTGEIRIKEKETGKMWYSNPPDRASDMLVTMRPLINSQFYVKLFNLEKRIELDWNNYTHSIKKGGMSYELVENGVKFIFGFPTANVYIPVQYTLCDDGFQAEVVTSEIKGVGSNAYVVESVTLLPYFGAAGLEEDGYLFVPDGSGALINYNNNKQNSAIYVSDVYDRNITLEQETAGTVKERISMPVFGSVCKGKDGAADSAFLGVIISGEASTNITANTSKKVSSYNMVYSTAVYRDFRLRISASNSNWAGVETRVLALSDDILNGKNYAIRYYFLSGDDANYIGMAERYREHLEEKQMLKDSKLAEDKYLVLDLVGAVSIEKYVFGIKQAVVTPLTTYNDVVTIVKELKEKGVDKLIINYVGALDGGLNNKMFSSVKTESVLGSKKEFQAMLDYLNEQNVQFFLETNPVDLYNNGNGYDNNADSVKSFFDKYAFQHNYILDSLKPAAERWHLLHPAKVPAFVGNFAESAASWKIGNVSLSRLGEVLYSDYADDVAHTTRTHTLELWMQAMQSADEKSEYLMVHGGNAYTLAYADVVTDTATGCSDYDMEDQAIPFYQIAFQGNTVLTPAPLNTTVDYTREFLKALETGCSLKYNLIYSDVASLVGTEYNTMVSYSYAYWKDIVVDQYLSMQKATAQFAGENIIAHQQIAEDVSLTEYETGKIIVNYRDEAYTYEGTEIGARAYVVLPGGAK